MGFADETEKGFLFGLDGCRIYSERFGVHGLMAVARLLTTLPDESL
jgi:hypothetical protein